MPENTSFYYATTLSNFARGFDKYATVYRKINIPQSTYPNEFYLLTKEGLAFGLSKASRLVKKLAIVGDAVMVLRSDLPEHSVRPNTKNGIGYVLDEAALPFEEVLLAEPDSQTLTACSVEEAMARSLALNAAQFTPYEVLSPRSISFLPIARGCQAACPFCFSEASISADQAKGSLSASLAAHLCRSAHVKGAERAVITGGGEPMLLPWARLKELIETCKDSFDKVVLITNGVQLSVYYQDETPRRLQQLSQAGLSVLALSRHHFKPEVNRRLMGLDTHTERVLAAARTLGNSDETLKPRLICVLQRGGIETQQDVADYVRWAAAQGVEEICFKELYVSTSLESVYYSKASNTFSQQHHIPLSVVLNWAKAQSFERCAELPWGAPVFSGKVDGKPVRVAAYSEPSLFWERSKGIARSWNVMSDGSVFASLEDRASRIGVQG